MSIEKFEYQDDNPHRLEYIAIDLRTTKYKNRLLEILLRQNMATGETYYAIEAGWTEDRFHPQMHLDEDDIETLAGLLNEWIDAIKARKGK
jgi:hypothetical protein